MYTFPSSKFERFELRILYRRLLYASLIDWVRADTQTNKKVFLGKIRYTWWVRCRNTYSTKTKYISPARTPHYPVSWICLLCLAFNWFRRILSQLEVTRALSLTRSTRRYHHTTRVPLCTYGLSRSVTAYRTCDTRVYSTMDTDWSWFIPSRSTQFCV